MSWVAVEEFNVTLFPLASIIRSLDDPVVDKVVSAEILKFILLSVWPATFIVEKCEPTEIGAPTFTKSSVFIREFELVFSNEIILLPFIFPRVMSNSLSPAKLSAAVTNCIVSMPLTVAVPSISSIAVIINISLSYGSVSTTLVPETREELVAAIVSFTPGRPWFSVPGMTKIELEIIGVVGVTSVVGVSVAVELMVSVTGDVAVSLPQLDSNIASMG